MGLDIYSPRLILELSHQRFMVTFPTKGAPMMPTCQCPSCAESVSFHPDDAGEVTTCRKCNTPFIIPKPGPAVAPAPVIPKREDPPAMQHLRELRSRSCYRVARGRIELVFVFSLMLGLVSLFGCIGIFVENTAMGIVAGAITVIMIGLLIVAWNLSIAFVDLADASILRLSKDR
jgi:hypothetical protein